MYVIGEHGPRAIPVYGGEQDYDAVRTEATTVLKRIMESGVARNIATGIRLARLIEVLGGDEQIMCVSAPNEEHHGVSLTWPHVINSQGLVKRVELNNIGPKATQQLKELVKARRAQ